MMGQTKHNIFLIGFMGAGKSTVALTLKKKLGMELIEMDQELVKREGMPINDIFKLHGEEYFRDAESRLVEEICKKNNCIVSCGGGAVVRPQNVENMKKSGRIVLLSAKPETIYARVKNSKDRPILNGNMNVEFISELMEKRREAYLEAADLIIETDGKTIQQVCEEIHKECS